MDPFHWPEFIQSNVEFSTNTIQEALDRESSKDIFATRCIASYMVMRRETIGTRPCIVLMRSTRRLYLQEHVLQHPIIAELENTALDMVFIANVRLVRLSRRDAGLLTDISVAFQDIYSFKKELGDNGALNNIITVIEKDPTTQHLDLQGRLHHAGRIFQAALDRFSACRDGLPSFGDGETDRQVAAFADGLVDWVLGSIEWSMVNQRYHVFVNDDDRRKNIIRLDDSWFMSARFRLLLLFSTSVVISYVLFLMMS